ncbi:MAG: hypothetical protein R3240_10240 [Gammaproteobacteria bacterium]|nr:hypothetical protein [Gammaproteobacteria bacterium]
MADLIPIMNIDELICQDFTHVIGDVAGRSFPSDSYLNKIGS